jgi:hypothetical protein
VLPNDEHVARICPKSTLADGRPGVGSFAPHAGTPDRPADDALSMHWLEYRKCDGTLIERIAELRAFLLASPFGKSEFKPTAQGLIAAIPIGQLQLQSVPELGTAFECLHTPRCYAVLDPHADLRTNPPMLQWPDDEAFRLAVQQFICDQVVHFEAGKV